MAALAGGLAKSQALAADADRMRRVDQVKRSARGFKVPLLRN
jgi:hypothetical protein